MPNRIATKAVSSLADYVKVIEELTSGSDVYWFRGHSKADYKLEPTLFRHSSPSFPTVQKTESDIYREFYNRSPSFDFGQRKDKWDLLFLMQHYRVPTRLLDWTASPLAALFFALSDASAKVDAAVWIIGPAKWNSGVLSDIGVESAVFTPADQIVDPYHPASEVKIKRAEPLAIEGILRSINDEGSHRARFEILRRSVL